ncbi:MAG: HlyD family efflux transporter periplasmic adaptor subunit [Candidatus Eisenbacteria bacterium]|nr:HlyD family efflux transporter periplasmic adaptor subunit [Candidatus Eisenbacteria bacterium]
MIWRRRKRRLRPCGRACVWPRWSCCSHPGVERRPVQSILVARCQTMQSEPSHSSWRRAGLIGFFAAVILSGCGGGNAGPHPSGTLEATEIELSPQMGGKVLEVRAALGERVAAGDTLIVIDTETISLQRRQAEARLGSLESQLTEARHHLQQARRKLALAETTLARTRILVRQGSAPQQRLDDVSAERDVAADQVSALAARLAALRGQLEEAAASVAVLDRRLADGVVVAPQAGTVLVRALEPGETASPGRLGLRIADLRRLELRVFLEAEDLDLVQTGMRVPVRVDALEGEELRGRVSWISPEAEFTPKNVQTRDARAQLVYAVKVEVENPEGRLSIGMPAEVVLPAAAAGEVK